jgi:hypothetical protein
VQKGREKTPAKRRTQWKNLGGYFTTRYGSLLDFKFAELNQDKLVTGQAHVDDKTSKEDSSYDMIICMDLLCNIGLTVIIINVFYFNCAFADPIGSNLNKQKGSHNALLKKLDGRLVNQCQTATQGMSPIPG